MDIYIYMYIYIICVYIYTYIYICVCVRVCTHANKHYCMRGELICTRICIDLYTYMSAYIYTHTHAQVHVPVSLCAHTHTLRRISPRPGVGIRVAQALRHLIVGVRGLSRALPELLGDWVLGCRALLGLGLQGLWIRGFRTEGS